MALLVLCGVVGQLVQIAVSPEREGCIGLILGLTLGAFPALALSIVYGGRE